jgi:hypothetical protein
MRIVVAAVVLAGFAIILLMLTRSEPARPDTHVEPSFREPVRPTATVPALASQPSPADLDAHAKRERLVARIRDPKAGYEPWDDKGLAILDRVARVAVATTDRGCYMAGCIATFTFPSAEVYQSVVEEITATPEWIAWTGGKQFSPPEKLVNQQVVVAVVLERPD